MRGDDGRAGPRGNGVGHDRGHREPGRRTLWGASGGPVQARRRVARGVLHRARRDGLRDRPRARGSRAGSRATASPCCARPASSGRTRTSRSPPPAASSSRSIPPTPPRSARGWRATPSRASSSARTPSRWRRSSPCATSCPSSRRSSRSSRLEGALSLDELRERGRGRDAGEVAARIAAVKPEDPYTIIYTSGTTGPPKGCVLTQDNYRQVTRMCEEIDVIEAGELVYLFLPLAHSYALLIQLLCVDLGAPLIYWSGDPQQIVPGPDGDQAGLPAVGAADLREDLHARHLQQRPGEDRRGDASSGLTVRRMQEAGQEVPRVAAGRLRQGRRRALRQRPQHLRRQPQAGDLGRRADLDGDPRVLLRLRRARARGLRDDRDLDGHAPPRPSPTTGSAPSAARSRAPRSRSPTTARSSSAARTSSAATTAPATRPRSAP